MIRRYVFIVLCGVMGIVTAFGQRPFHKDFTVNIENYAVNQYMESVDYQPHDCSVIGDYRIESGYRFDYPAPVLFRLPQTVGIDSLLIVCCDHYTLKDSLIFHVSTKENVVELYNFIPQRTYHYIVFSGDKALDFGFINTQGNVRMLKIPGTVNNIRDMGGWRTADGKRVKYGMMFRGSELNGTFVATDEGIELLKSLGIEAELDLRAWYNREHGVSAFGFLDSSHTTYGNTPSFYYSNDSGQLSIHLDSAIFKNKWRYEFQFIVRNLRAGRAIYQHCVQGKDRTGYLSFLLEGLLGVEYSDLVKDYELTYFYVNAPSAKDSIDKVYDFIETMEGETLRDKFNSYFVHKLYVSQSDIDYFREVMLESIDNKDIATWIDDTADNQYDSHNNTYYDLTGRKANTVRKGSIYLMKDHRGVMRKYICK